MQLDPVEVYDLMGLINRIGPFQYDPGLIEWYYELVGRLADQVVSVHIGVGLFEKRPGRYYPP